MSKLYTINYEDRTLILDLEKVVKLETFKDVNYKHNPEKGYSEPVYSWVIRFYYNYAIDRSQAADEMVFNDEDLFKGYVDNIIKIWQS